MNWEVYELRIIAERVTAKGDTGIGALIYYCAELLERRSRLPVTVAREAIDAGETASDERRD